MLPNFFSFNVCVIFCLSLLISLFLLFFFSVAPNWMSKCAPTVRIPSLLCGNNFHHVCCARILPGRDRRLHSPTYILNALHVSIDCEESCNNNDPQGAFGIWHDNCSSIALNGILLALNKPGLDLTDDDLREILQVQCTTAREWNVTVWLRLTRATLLLQFKGKTKVSHYYLRKQQ